MDLELKEGLMGTKEEKCKLVPSFVVKIDFIFYQKINQRGFKIKWMCKTFIIIAQCSLHINYTLSLGTFKGNQTQPHILSTSNPFLLFSKWLKTSFKFGRLKVRIFTFSYLNFKFFLIVTF
jgi:hypothetical protein